MTLNHYYDHLQNCFDDTVSRYRKRIRQHYQFSVRPEVKPLTADQLQHRAEILERHRTAASFQGKEAAKPDVSTEHYAYITSTGADLWYWGYSRFVHEQKQVFFSDEGFHSSMSAIADFCQAVATLTIELEQHRMYAEAWQQEFGA